MKLPAISRSFLVFLLSLFTLMMSTSPASARTTAAANNYTFAVNTTADTHDINPGDGICADSSGNCSLRAAIEEADALSSGSSITITVPANTYLLTLGTLSLTSNTITINGADRKTTIIKGNHTFAILSIPDTASVTVNISGVTIEGGQNDYGGGISNFNGVVRVSNSTITDNSAPYGGGGIYNDGGSGFATVSLSNSIVSGNSADTFGGGIYNTNYGTVNVSNSTISDNTGGGISAQGYHGGSNVNVSNSTISGNSATFGGGIEEDSADITVSNSTISGNSATAGDGGAIYMPNSNGGTIIVNNSTFSDNSATGKGGAIANDNINGSITLSGTIVANSKGASNCHGKITDKGYNLDSGTSCRFTRNSDLSNTNPNLGPLRKNGGPTKTMALLKGSKAIDWAALSSCPASDQRGQPRPDGNGENTCDIGAYESAY